MPESTPDDAREALRSMSNEDLMTELMSRCPSVDRKTYQRRLLALLGVSWVLMMVVLFGGMLVSFTLGETGEDGERTGGTFIVIGFAGMFLCSLLTWIMPDPHFHEPVRTYRKSMRTPQWVEGLMHVFNAGLIAYVATQDVSPLAWFFAALTVSSFMMRHRWRRRKHLSIPW